MSKKVNLVMDTLLPSNKNMKKLILFSTFFFSVSVYALPDCPSDYSVRWHNCFGSFPFEWGDKYVGEFKNYKLHGQGTFIFVDGKRLVGHFMNGEYIPDICEGMGLVKGTESFGNCVNNLIDDL